MDWRSLDSQAGYGEDGGMDKKALAAFLRHRREMLRPRDVGLVEGPRRRTQGLRREEVSVSDGLCTGVAPETEVTVVASGRSRNVNVAVGGHR
jgi:hypothetical protein